MLLGSNGGTISGDAPLLQAMLSLTSINEAAINNRIRIAFFMFLVFIIPAAFEYLCIYTEIVAGSLLQSHKTINEKLKKL